jgi:hypothetical protein
MGFLELFLLLFYFVVSRDKHLLLWLLREIVPINILHESRWVTNYLYINGASKISLLLIDINIYTLGIYIVYIYLSVCVYLWDYI